jgi:hypothetical protein
MFRLGNFFPPKKRIRSISLRLKLIGKIQFAQQFSEMDGATLFNQRHAQRRFHAKLRSLLFFPREKRISPTDRREQKITPLRQRSSAIPFFCAN